METASQVVLESPAKSESNGPRPRPLLSPGTAAKLAAASPKYVPPTVVAPGTEEAAEISPIVREPDKPRNQIIRLPRYIVGEQKLHVPKEELRVFTPKGRVEYAFNRRPGLRFGPLAFLNAPIALEMLEEDLRAQRRAEESDLWSLYLVREPTPAAQTK